MNKSRNRLRRWGACLMALAALGILIQIRCASDSLNYRTSYFGNSFPGTPKQLHFQDDIQALYVAPDGTCYADSVWDEGGVSAGIYKEGREIGACAELHGWGRNGGKAITADSHYLYVGMTESGDDGGNDSLNTNNVRAYPPRNSVWYCVRRYTLSGTPVPFPTGAGYDGSMLVVSTGTRPQPNTPYSGADLSGVAAEGDSLYVSDPTTGQIKKYSLATLSATPKQSWSLPRPGAMVTADGSLFVIQKGNGADARPKAQRYSPTGDLQGTITFAPGVVPAALAFSPNTQTLLVADQGPDQNIKKYRLSALMGVPTHVAGTFGVTGGVYAGTGAQIGKVGPLRFNNPTGMGVDAQGNFYISQDGAVDVTDGDGGGGVLECYTTPTTLRWQLSDLEFVDCAGVDPTLEDSVFTKKEHFVMNYDRTAPGSEASYVGYTVNRLKYPEDPRMHIGMGHEQGAWVRRFRGHKFLITTDMYQQYLIISRFDTATEGECAVPSVVFSQNHHMPDSSGWPENEPASGEWIWRNSDGHGKFEAHEYTQPSASGDAPSTWGWWMDSRGDVWQATQGGGIRHYVCQGLDVHGNPIYSYTHMTTISMPHEFNDLERVLYYPDTDTMYLSGFSPDHPNDHGYWGGLGRVVCRYDHWSTSHTVHPGYPMYPPCDGTPPVANDQILPISLDVAGSCLFVADSHRNLITVYSEDTGASLGTIIPGAAVGGDGKTFVNILGWVDIRNGITAFRRANGEYLIFDEDDWMGKIVMYRWSPRKGNLND